MKTTLKSLTPDLTGKKVRITHKESAYEGELGTYSVRTWADWVDWGLQARSQFRRYTLVDVEVGKAKIEGLPLDAELEVEL